MLQLLQNVIFDRLDIGLNSRIPKYPHPQSKDKNLAKDRVDKDFYILKGWFRYEKSEKVILFIHLLTECCQIEEFAYRYH